MATIKHKYSTLMNRNQAKDRNHVQSTRKYPWSKAQNDTLGKLRAELRSYIDLSDDWDGEGAKAPLSTAVNDALTFLDQCPKDIPLPCANQGREGEVGIYWDFAHSKIFVEATFEGNGKFSYFAVQGTPSQIFEKSGMDDVSVYEVWPKDMIRFLQKPNTDGPIHHVV